MDITLQVFAGDRWSDAAEVTFDGPEGGYPTGAYVGYNIDYYADNGSIDYANGHPAVDHRAVSVRYPLDMADRYTSRWPAFLLDLLPQGHARLRLAKAMGLDANARSSDIRLLLRSAGSTIGNVRIKEAAEEEVRRLEGVERVGLTYEDLVDRTDRFIEVVDRYSMIASGSSGLQGEWPKVALTLAKDGLYYPDPLVADDEAVEHLIVKLRRGGDVDGLILSMEAAYSQVAHALGLDVYKPSVAGNGTLIIGRFDRRVEEGRTVRIGQESMVSAAGVSEFGHVEEHERYVGIVKAFSTDPQADVLEYLKRDAANLALGNPDNHGRNTALSKYPDGTVRLSPLFDFAPMKLAGEVIARSTFWRCMKDRGSDYAPDWATVCEAVAGDGVDGQILAERLAQFADALEAAPGIAREFGADAEGLSRATGACGQIADDLRKAVAKPGLGGR